MTDTAVKTPENSKLPGKPFAKNDPRINRKGRPRVPKSAIELQKLIDEIAAEEVENPNTGERIQRIRAMLRSMMTGKDTSGKVHILDRRYGKVQDKLDLSNSDGTLKPEKGLDDERFDRAISTLADALRDSLSGKSPEQNSDVGSAK